MLVWDTMSEIWADDGDVEAKYSVGTLVFVRQLILFRIIVEADISDLQVLILMVVNRPRKIWFLFVQISGKAVICPRA